MEFDKVSIQFAKNLFEDDDEKKMVDLIFKNSDELTIIEELINLEKKTKKHD